MNVKTLDLIDDLKENNEDFEFYPTTEEIILAIKKHIFKERNYSYQNSFLDIGAGNGNFKKIYNNITNIDIHISKYYAIEKSKILINKLINEAIILGNDFHQTSLIDKKVDIIFCNPPFSEFEEWSKRIIFEGNCKYIYLVIPERWKQNKEILTLLEDMNLSYEIIGNFDFLNAERQARANIDIVFIKKDRQIKDYAFNKWFDDTFKIRDNKNKYEYEIAKEKKEELKTKIVSSESKAKMLVDLYQNELNTLYNHFKAISSLDIDILNTIGIQKENVKEALRQKLISLKNIYWQTVFSEIEEITSRLTSKSRDLMLERFTELLTVDFTIENIYTLIIWVISNSNQYYNEQLIDFFEKLSNPENIKNYKSNYKIFKLSKYRHNTWDNPKDVTHYTLDYRIVCSYLFDINIRNYERDLCTDRNLNTLNDFIIIAKNLGFECTYKEKPYIYGKKYNLYFENNKGQEDILLEYKIYKNGNTHLRFNIEFAKALNVEASRLLGWISCKEDIQKEFIQEMANGAEKYFKTNKYLQIESGLKLLTIKK